MVRYDLGPFGDTPSVKAARRARLAFELLAVVGLASIPIGWVIHLAAPHSNRLAQMVAVVLAWGAIGPALIGVVFFLTVTSPPILGMEIGDSGLTFISLRGTGHFFAWDALPWNFSLRRPTKEIRTGHVEESPLYRPVRAGRIEATIPIDASNELIRQANENGLEFVPRATDSEWTVFALQRRGSVGSSLARQFSVAGQQSQGLPRMDLTPAENVVVFGTAMVLAAGLVFLVGLGLPGSQWFVWAPIGLAIVGTPLLAVGLGLRRRQRTRGRERETQRP